MSTGQELEMPPSLMNYGMVMRMVKTRQVLLDQGLLSRRPNELHAGDLLDPKQAQRQAIERQEEDDLLCDTPCRLEETGSPGKVKGSGDPNWEEGHSHILCLRASGMGEDGRGLYGVEVFVDQSDPSQADRESRRRVMTLDPDLMTTSAFMGVPYPRSSGNVGLWRSRR
ncbi:hypothetical protein BDW71DRAFT_207381 [Aspergillus fruticulosus]